MTLASAAWTGFLELAGLRADHGPKCASGDCEIVIAPGRCPSPCPLGHACYDFTGCGKDAYVCYRYVGRRRCIPRSSVPRLPTGRQRLALRQQPARMT